MEEKKVEKEVDHQHDLGKVHVQAKEDQNSLALKIELTRLEIKLQKLKVRQLELSGLGQGSEPKNNE
jgi:hypothetical protein